MGERTGGGRSVGFRAGEDLVFGRVLRWLDMMGAGLWK